MDDGMGRYISQKCLINDLCLPNSSIFSNLLQSCIGSRSLRDARRVHARIIKSQFASEIFIQNRLVDSYAKCGCLDDARKVFDKMPQWNTFSWNSMISAFTKSGFLDEALSLFQAMPDRDQCSWNSMVSGFAQHDRFEEALEFFSRMHREDFVLNMYAFSSALSACAGLMDLKMGLQIHALILKSRFSSDVYMGSALIDMYSKCGSVLDASRVFHGMPERNIVSWNSLITCYEQNGPTNEALELFLYMMKCGIQPDEVTLASVVSACAGLSLIREGLQIHAIVIKSDDFRDDLVLCNALVDMYAKCRRIREARYIFDRMPARDVVSMTSMVNGYSRAASMEAAYFIFMGTTERNVVSWNALIAGYVQNGENKEALELFLLLKRESVFPTHYTFANILCVCANLANLRLGRQAHTHVLKHGFRFESGPESDIFVGNSLVDMYAKCGSVEDGFRVFERMIERDKVSWNAMIMGYAQNGYGNDALALFRRMLMSKEKPDHVTMIGVLCACSHAGLVEEGYSYFCSIREEHGLEPSKDHYTCMVDLLGRAGRLDEAEKFIESMPVQPDSVLWGSLLAACKVHRNIDMGKRAAEKLLQLDPTNSGPYVLLSNMYAEQGKWGEVVRVRKLMRQRGVVKQPGCSWIEVKSQVHVFMVKDKRHPQRKEIYTLLKVLVIQMKQAGYVPDVGAVASEMPFNEESQKLEIISQSQSEMLAVAVG
ncbi:pentatricopeptide repeat-containing protein [Cinnamomum micranthum f. kanehirae]|uniref:Pentatricopeptide repeat-containing protein n=1 Tax=Cinnamomum micranthum f. kanehirae TaxID=337451 RepID=A0A3S3N5K7_9MAGN|nr:pentatricopeptide repeat-containing protein [Cinnamomum micranthum f. kanehirae]